MRLNDPRLRALADSGAHVHLVGVGGVGMEGLARLLMQLGCRVSGSDMEPSPALDILNADGVVVQAGHSPDVVGAGVSLVVYSAAVPRENPELVAARIHGCRHCFACTAGSGAVAFVSHGRHSRHPRKDDDGEHAVPDPG